MELGVGLAQLLGFKPKIVRDPAPPGVLDLLLNPGL